MHKQLPAPLGMLTPAPLAPWQEVNNIGFQPDWHLRALGSEIVIKNYLKDSFHSLLLGRSTCCSNSIAQKASHTSTERNSEFLEEKHLLPACSLCQCPLSTHPQAEPSPHPRPVHGTPHSRAEVRPPPTASFPPPRQHHIVVQTGCQPENVTWQVPLPAFRLLISTKGTSLAIEMQSIRRRKYSKHSGEDMLSVRNLKN